jgi:hypothetical protein
LKNHNCNLLLIRVESGSATPNNTFDAYPILLNSIDAGIKSEIGRSRVGLRHYPLRFHVEGAGTDAKLIQHWPAGVAYHHRYSISTGPVARITAPTTVPINGYILL